MSTNSPSPCATATNLSSIAICPDLSAGHPGTTAATITKSFSNFKVAPIPSKDLAISILNFAALFGLK